MDEFENAKRDTQLQISTAVIYEDNRAHVVFSDNTALILHTKGDCVTFFSKNGTKTRALVRFVVNSTAKSD